MLGLRFEKKSGGKTFFFEKIKGGWGNEHVNHQNGGEVDNGKEKGAESGKGRVLIRSESGLCGES